MKKSLLLIAMFGLFALATKAQPTQPHCYTYEMTDPLIANDPQYQLNIQALDQFTQNFIHDQQMQRRGSNQLYIIPVVFHILHNYGPENVSDSTIIESLRQINLDYRKLNADTVNIIPQFQGIAADCEIEFRLATLDPNGNCTNGIEHIPTLETYLANDSSKRNPNWQIWPNNKYLNIWVAHSLQNASAAAYAHKPGGANNTDGIMCWYLYVDNGSNTLTHEFGHHFNLDHTWGPTNDPEVPGNCALSDQVADTPPTEGYSPGHCPDTNAAKNCNPTVVENWQNYMDYSYCDMMFTAGQKARMQACLNATASGRNNLWQSANLIATGTDQLITPACAPVADFKAESYAACVGDPVRFFNQSWKGYPTNWTWDFPGGTPASSTDKDPIITYATAGEYTVTLKVSNANGADSITKTSVVHISGTPQSPLPYNENFENTTSFPGIDGWIQNNDGGIINWERVNFASADSGTYSIRVNNYVNTVRNVEDWITPSFSFTGVTFPIKLSFDVAHALRNSTVADQLQVFYSSDCGQNWTASSYSKSGATLQTNNGIYVPTSFTPNSTQWRHEIVTINAVQNLPQVRFKFVNTTDRGNNVYVDNINITGNFTGIDEQADFNSAISVYPNPTQGVSYVDFSLIRSGVISLEVKDIIGKSVSKVISNKKFDSGLNHVELPVLSPGIYMINVTVNNNTHVVRLVVN